MDCYRCLIQWGYLQKQAEKWIYPIPVLEAFIATKTCISNNHSAAGYVGYWTWDKDITTEYAYSWNNYPSYCFMIGKVQQQWGMNTIGSRTTRTEAYPLPYSEFCLPIVSGNGYVGGLNYGFGIGVTNFDLTSVTIVNNSEDSSYRWTGYTYIVVGAQPQWGLSTGQADLTTILPFPMTESFISLCCSNSYWTNAGCYVSNTAITLSQAQTDKASTRHDGPLCWLVFGKQPQWGSSASLSGYVAVCIFPISFTTTDYTAVATGVMSAADATFGKENYVNNMLWELTSESQVAFRLSHLDRPTLKYIAIGF